MEDIGVLGWSRYVALGDSLTVGEGDTGPDGRWIGWARRLARLLTARTSVSCGLTNLAVGGATVPIVLREQLPAVAGLRPDLISVTVGMNDLRVAEFRPEAFAAGFGQLLDGLTVTGATVLASTLPDIAEIAPTAAPNSWTSHTSGSGRPATSSGTSRRGGAWSAWTPGRCPAPTTLGCSAPTGFTPTPAATA